MKKLLTDTAVLRGLFVGILALGSCGVSSDSQTTSPIVTTKSCSTAADCPSGQVCAYPQASGCAAQGRCLVYPNPGTIHCNSIIVECGCAGDKIGVPCDYPSGYAPAPIKSANAATCL